MEPICQDCGIAKPLNEFKSGNRPLSQRVSKRCLTCRQSEKDRRRQLAADGLRLCGTCKQVKPATDFTNSTERYLSHQCRKCASDSQEARRRRLGRKQRRRYSKIGNAEIGFVCRGCNVRKPVCDFPKRNAAGHLDYRCKACTAERRRIDSRTLRGQFNDSRGHARRGHIQTPWSLTFEEFAALRVQPCVYCGFPLPETGCGLDRKSCAGGYTLDNVVPCCFECNIVKCSIFTYDEMLLLGRAIAKVKTARVAAGKPMGRDPSSIGWGRPRKHSQTCS